MLHVVYRFYAGENNNGRPDWYSKELCARSILRSLEVAGVHGVEVDLTVYRDGPQDHPAAEELRAVGREVVTAGLGNAGSFLDAVVWSLDQGWSDDDLVYFVEDDYLHAPTALTELARAAETLTVLDYFSLYEHPNNYSHWNAGTSDLVMLAGRHWRTVISTCMTFALTVRTLRRDAAVFARFCAYDPPADFDLWLALQGAPLELRADNRFVRRVLGARFFEWSAHSVYRKRRHPGHRLGCSLPSLATHADLAKGLALGVDWNRVATEVASRGDGRPSTGA